MAELLAILIVSDDFSEFWYEACLCHENFLIETEIGYGFKCVYIDLAVDLFLIFFLVVRYVFHE